MLLEHAAKPLHLRQQGRDAALCILATGFAVSFAALGLVLPQPFLGLFLRKTLFASAALSQAIAKLFAHVRPVWLLFDAADHLPYLYLAPYHLNLLVLLHELLNDVVLELALADQSDLDL